LELLKIDCLSINFVGLKFGFSETSEDLEFSDMITAHGMVPFRGVVMASEAVKDK
jgi:hypothetical protein